MDQCSTRGEVLKYGTMIFIYTMNNDFFFFLLINLLVIQYYAIVTKSLCLYFVELQNKKI